MDSFLIDYLKSGEAWLLVGSGPSSEMGYPTWRDLAEGVIQTIRRELPNQSVSVLEAAARAADFPRVFQDAEPILGGPLLLEILRSTLRPTRHGAVYRLIARWPVPVYMTTNYDDELTSHLSQAGAAYVQYSNSEDHLALLVPDCSGAIVKLHGDLRSEAGLVLTTSQYRAIAESDPWAYWRTKMTSIFQMTRVVIIGHSLTDPNIRHVLEAAKKGAGVHRPVCWIAPNVPTSQVREFLETYRIRVIPYEDKDGTHRHLTRLIESITAFVPPRTSIHIRQRIAKVAQSPLGANSSAPGFFVFNKLAAQENYEEKRVAIVVAALQAVLPELATRQPFSLQVALELSGWPTTVPLPEAFREQIRDRAISDGLLELAGPLSFRVGEHAQASAAENKRAFEHLRERFKESLRLRVRRSYPSLLENDALIIASDIEASLSGYFREGGLSLTTTIFGDPAQIRQSAVPGSIVRFIADASARYDDLLRRQAFCTVSVDAFVKAEDAERQYLGRVSQGFFAYHLLGAFGDVAIERLRQAKETVWLIDSNAQISALALASSTNAAFWECFTRLRDSGIRLFTTDRLFDETHEPFWFANMLVEENGPASSAVVAAARGQAPYRSRNEFLDGFIRWQAAGNPPDWRSYLFQIFRQRSPSRADVKGALQALGVEVVAFDSWPGFLPGDHGESEESTKKIVELRERRGISAQAESEAMSVVDLDKKARPEGEAFVIVERERGGTFYMLGEKGRPSPAWFISNTSLINLLGPAARITWPPEAFLRFSATISAASTPESGDRAFEALLWGLAQSGVTLLDEGLIASVLGSVVDQAMLSVAEQQELYRETLAVKYGVPPEEVLKRLPPSNRLLGVIQLAREMAQVQSQRLHRAESALDAERKRAERAEKSLKEVERYRKKVEERRERGRAAAKSQPRSKKSKKRKRKD